MEDGEYVVTLFHLFAHCCVMFALVVEVLGNRTEATTEIVLIQEELS